MQSFEGSGINGQRISKVEVTTTLAGTTDYNMFTVTGSVKIHALWGVVTTIIPAATTAANLNLFPTGGAAIQLTSAAGTDISALPVGSVLLKNAAAASAIAALNNTLGALGETVPVAFIVTKKTAVVTKIRLNVTEGNNTGAIKWYCLYEKISEDGLLA